MVKRKDYTLIQISPEIREKLLSRGNKGETYNDIIERLLLLEEEEKQVGGKKTD